MEKNVLLMEEAVGAILANPEQHTQNHWRCETGMCFAGWTGVMAGATWSSAAAFDDSVVVDGEVIHVSDFAQAALGLTDAEATVMFFWGNTADDLARMVKNIANGDWVGEGFNDWRSDPVV